MSELGAFLRWLTGDVIRDTPRRRLLMVAGSASGCGTSTVARMLARAISLSGGEALLLDASSESLSNVRQWVPVIPRYDAAIVDVGSRLGQLRALLPAFSDSVRGSDQLLVVTRPEPRDCAAAYALVKYVGARSLAPRMHLLVNCADADLAARSYERVEAATRRFCHRSVAYAGAFPRDPLLHSGIPDASMDDAPGRFAADAAASDLFRRLLRPFPTHESAPGSRRLLTSEIQ